MEKFFTLAVCLLLLISCMSQYGRDGMSDDFSNVESLNEWKRLCITEFYPDKAETMEASKKLLAVLLPELEQNHWPDWETINSQ